LIITYLCLVGVVICVLRLCYLIATWDERDRR
jgi:hypothetical protein